MFSGNNIRLYVESQYDTLLSNHVLVNSDKYQPNSFLLVKDHTNLPCVINYFHHDGETTSAFALNQDLNTILCENENSHFEQKIREMPISQCIGELTESERKRLKDAVLASLDPHYTFFFLTSDIPINICARSELKNHPADWVKPRTCLLIVEDELIPWSLYHVSALHGLQPIETEIVAGLTESLIKLPTNKKTEQFNHAELQFVMAALASYKNAIIPCKRVAQSAMQLIHSVRSMTASEQEQFLVLVTKYFKMASVVDWGIDSGVIDDVALHFLAHLKKRVEKMDVNAVLDRNTMEDMISITLHVAIKFCNEDMPKNLNYLFHGRYSQAQINALERSHLSILEFKIHIHENDRDQILAMLKINNHHRKKLKHKKNTTTKPMHSPMLTRSKASQHLFKEKNPKVAQDANHHESNGKSQLREFSK